MTPEALGPPSASVLAPVDRGGGAAGVWSHFCILCPLRSSPDLHWPLRGVEEAEKRGPYRERGPWVKGLAGDPCRFLGERLPKAGFVAGQEVRVGFWEEVGAGLGLKDADAGITVAGGRVPRKGS